MLHPSVSPFSLRVVCLGVFPLFTIWNLIKISWLLDLLSVFFLVILELKKAIVVTILSRASIISVHMLPFLRPHYILSFRKPSSFVHFRLDLISSIPLPVIPESISVSTFPLQFIRNSRTHRLYCVIQPPTHLLCPRLRLPTP